MNYLDNIDWHNHDGVNLGMINDFVRNQFYDRVLSRYVKDQYCTDIGFGTGLLSMMALKHGAHHVRAFESDYNRYLLGCDIIKDLGLSHKIELINDRYTRDIVPTPVTFTETVNGNLWWEGLWNSLPTDNKSVFLPGNYFLEIWAVPIPKSFAQGMCVEADSKSRFNPGVDIDLNFINTVNKYVGGKTIVDPELPNGIVHFKRQQDTIWGWVPYLRAAQAGRVVAHYSADKWEPKKEYFELTVDTTEWRNQHVLIVPRMGMKQDTDVLYLDVGHWGPGEDPILLVNPTGDLIVRHNVNNGIITYSLKD